MKKNTLKRIFAAMMIATLSVSMTMTAFATNNESAAAEASTETSAVLSETETDAAPSETETDAAPSETETDAAETDVAPSETETDAAETDVAPSETETDSAETDVAPSETETDSAETDVAPSETETDASNDLVATLPELGEEIAIPDEQVPTAEAPEVLPELTEEQPVEEILPEIEEILPEIEETATLTVEHVLVYNDVEYVETTEVCDLMIGEMVNTANYIRDDAADVVYMNGAEEISVAGDMTARLFYVFA